MSTVSSFEFDLDRILNRKNSVEEEEIFCETYIDPETEESFSYVKKAADRGYDRAYEALADHYAQGIGCSENWEKAFQYWNLSVQNNRYGYAKIGECYRLGKGTDKNYDKAWEAYETAYERHDDLQENPSIEELLLINPSINEQNPIEISWLEYAVKRQTKPIPAWLYREIAFIYFKNEPEGYLHWINMAAQSGDIEAKCELYYQTQDPAVQQKLLQEIFSEKKYDAARDSVKELAMKIIDDKAFEELAAKILYNEGEIDWLEDHYQKQNRMAELKYILDGADDKSIDKIAEGCFRCRSCHRVFLIDSLDDPDAQGDVCNECYYSGECLIEEKAEE